MSPIARLILSALVLVVGLSARAETVTAADGEGAIVITLPADLSAEQRDAFMEALARLEQPVVVAGQAPAAEDDTAGGVALAMEIQDDPRLGPMLLQPVKSQGVTQVDDSGFVIGVKFVARPGQQFMVRREAYARIKQAFVENGIEFASRRVTVDSEAEGQAARAAGAGIAATG